MKHNPRLFFQNKDCSHFPCHKLSPMEMEDFSCIFCYCPLMSVRNCGGVYEILPDGTKDCSECKLAHLCPEDIVQTIKDKELYRVLK